MMTFYLADRILTERAFRAFVAALESVGARIEALKDERPDGRIFVYAPPGRSNRIAIIAPREREEDARQACRHFGWGFIGELPDLPEARSEMSIFA